MIRHAARGGLLFALIAAAVSTTAYAQTGAGDRVFYRDKKFGPVPQTATGEVKEGPGGIKVVSAGKTVADLSPADVIKIVPGSDLPGLTQAVIFELDGMENRKEYAKARKGYEDAAAAAAANPKTKKYVDFRLAILKAKMYDEADDKVRAAEQPGLIQALEGFLLSNPKTWEAWPVGRTLARLQFEKGDFDKARRTWGQLAKNADLPKDLQTEAGLNEVDNLIRAGDFAGAAARAADVAKAAPPAGAVRDRLAIYAKAAEAGAGNPATGAAEIEKLIAASKDPAVRGTGYAMIGELALAAGKPRDAMWAFLWVEVVFNADREEVGRAMTRLTKVFETLGEADKAELYRERLRKFRAAA